MRVFWTALILVVTADWLLFGAAPGISVSYFGVIVMLGVLANRPTGRWDGRRLLGMVLVLGALAQTAIEPNFFNGAVLVALAMLGAVSDAAREAGWRQLGRLALFAFLCIPVRLPAHFARFRQALPVAQARGRWGSRLGVASRLAFPALAVALPFVLLFSAGNALFHLNMQAINGTLGRLLAHLDLPTPGRIGFWCVVLVCALGMLVPAIVPAPAEAARQIFPETQLARWRTWTILAVVNALFLWTNVLDVVFLWLDQALPAGVSYSRYVHEGVAALIAATILSAIALLIIYRDRGGADGSGLTRGLALAWILQNWVLIAGVGLRLKLYVQAYDLSVLRFHVGSFLLLVAAGFALLAWRILDRKTLRWLVGTNALATFALFYGLQFVDVNAFVARYNTDRWFAGEARTIDVAYLDHLGSAGWPQLQRLETQDRWPGLARDARKYLAYDRIHRLKDDPHSGRGWQYRWAERKKAVFPNLPQDALLGP